MDDYSFLVVLALLFLFGPYIIAGFLSARLRRVESASKAALRLIDDLETVSHAQAEEIAKLRGEVLTLRGIAPEDASFEATGEISAKAATAQQGERTEDAGLAGEAGAAAA